MGFLSGPTPAYNNPPIEPQYFEPSRFVISDIAQGQTTTVTMVPSTTGGSTVQPNYVIGQLVRFVIPDAYGIRQINEKKGYVLSLPSSTQVEVDIDSTSFDPFITSPTDDSQDPQIIAVGDVNQGQINESGRVNVKTYIPGSFRNVSPR